MDDFKSLNLNYSYSTLTHDNVLSSFLLPVLKMTKNYYRSVGFFTVDSLIKISEGIKSIVKKDGKIRLLCSFVISDSDSQLIQLGYEERKKIINDLVLKEFSDEKINNFSFEDRENLIELIKYSFFEIKIVVKDDNSLFHDKVGVMIDESGNKIAFVGSMNDTVSGYEKNYEKIRVFKSWLSSENQYVINELHELEAIWNNNIPQLETFTIEEAVKNKILKKIEVKHPKPEEDSNPPPKESEEITLRQYQIDAIESWKKNNYKGFYKMATGTGKTWTAIFSIKQLFENADPIVIITAPYKHLVEQWAKDVYSTFPYTEIIKVFSDNKNWRSDALLLIKAKSFNPRKKMIFITTNSSFRLSDFQSILSKINTEKLLIVDEAHRFHNSISLLSNNDIIFDYKLGLSATPEYYNNIEKTDELVGFFGGIVFEYNLESAIENGYLVPYNYNPIFMNLTPQEQSNYRKYQMKIAGCFKNGQLICDQKTLMRNISLKRSVLSKSIEKDNNLMTIIDKLPEKRNFIVYVGDGRSIDDSYESSIRYIDTITMRMSKSNYKVHKFTAEEDTKTRLQLIDDFNENRVDSLVAIRCLDEGINIPSIKSALILSSSEDPREFIQRRGRILRTFKGKSIANIYDVIMLPSDDSGIDILKTELRRYIEYSRIAKNKDYLEKKLMELLKDYNLKLDEIKLEPQYINEIESEGDVNE